jgi:hypothetical protein
MSIKSQSKTPARMADLSLLLAFLIGEARLIAI